MIRYMQRRSVFQVSYKMINCIHLIWVVLLIAGCSSEVVQVRPKYSGDHTTAQIRGMWQICYHSRAKSQPYLPPPMHMKHCDCLVDRSREERSSEDYTKMGSDNLTKFFAELSLECDKGMFMPAKPDQT